MNYPNSQIVAPINGCARNVIRFDMELFNGYSDIDFLNAICYKLNECIDAVNLTQEQFTKIVDFVNNMLEKYVKEQLQQWLDDGTFKNLINNLLGIVTSYETLNMVIQDLTLVSGQRVQTLGSKTINDGGAGLYILSEVRDKFSVQLNNGLYANYVVIDNNVNVMSLGCDNTGATDSSNLLSTIITSNYNYVFPYGNYKFDSPLDIREINNITIEGNMSRIQSNFGFMKIGGCNFININNFYAVGVNTNIGIDFYDFDTSSTKSRSNNVNIKNVYLYNYVKGVNIDSSTGYMKFDNLHVGGNFNVGVAIGENFNSTVNPSPNYITFINSAFDGLSSQRTTTNVRIYCGLYITFNNCDFANNQLGLSISAIKSTHDISIVDCKFFNLNNGIVINEVEVSEYGINILGCRFNIISTGIGVNILGGNSISLVNNFFIGSYTYYINLNGGGNVIIKNNQTNLSLTPVYNYMKLNSMDMNRRDYIRISGQPYIEVPAGETATVNLNQKNSFLRSTFVTVTPVISNSDFTFTTAFDDSNITVSITNNNQGIRRFYVQVL